MGGFYSLSVRRETQHAGPGDEPSLLSPRNLFDWNRP